MRLSKRKWLYTGAILAALLQSGILFAAIEQRASILRNGKEVVLQTEPVDPRDLMRGDYVVLRYDISSIPRNVITGQPDTDQQRLYVSVKRGDDGIWHFSRASFEPFTSLEADEVQINGQASYAIPVFPSANVAVLYGIERFYVPEGEGRVIEDSQRANKITAVLAIDGSGQAVVKALRDDGQILYQEPLY